MVIMDIVTSDDRVFLYLFKDKILAAGVKNWCEISEEVLKISAEAAILVSFVSRRINI
jgi:hypothetical protein